MKMISYFKSMFLFGLGLMVIAVSSCDEGEETIDAPLAYFTMEVDEMDNLKWNFKDGSQGADTYSWDFGDGSGTSNDPNPTYTYSAAGSYTVVLTATNDGGSDTHSETISVLDNAAVSLFAETGFDSPDDWNVINFYECTNMRGAVNFNEGVVTWSETLDPDDGGWKHMGIYQEMTLEAGTYSLDFNVEYDGIADIWGEVFVGATPPTACTDTEGTDYSDNIILNALNAWDCNTSYSGSAVANSCKVPEGGVNGEFTLDSGGTYFFVIKIGGAYYGENGVKMSNIEMFKKS